jgi:hypothetical protein
VGVKVNKLSSTKTQLPYDYYSLPFCKPATIVNSAENLGEARPARARAPAAPPLTRRRHAGAARRPHRKQRVHGASAASGGTFVRMALTRRVPALSCGAAVDARGRVLQRHLRAGPA